MMISGPAFTSVFQGSVRFNNYTGVTVAFRLFGAQGLALAPICNAAIAPTVNILCVLVFARHGPLRLDRSGVLKQLVMNPLVTSCFAGDRIPVPEDTYSCRYKTGIKGIGCGLATALASLLRGGTGFSYVETMDGSHSSGNGASLKCRLASVLEEGRRFMMDSQKE